MGWRETRKIMLPLLMGVGFMMIRMTCGAAGFYENPYVTFTGDGQAWTIAQPLPSPEDAGNKEDPACWYPRGETWTTGVESKLAALNVGEHYYQREREELIPIGKWVVAHRPARCIHLNAREFHGYQETKDRCYASYYSGWNAYCADCGEVLTDCHIYLSRDRVKTLTEIDVSLEYYYHCPTCGHLEQGRKIPHICKGISANRYRVEYKANGGNVLGYMQPSYHMYDNVKEFEGNPVDPAVTLSRNTFQRPGFRFLGWNTEADGTGDFYEDEAEILNLTKENLDYEEGTGIVPLYAQWERIQGKLYIDPGKGSYLGQKGVQCFDVGYDEAFFVSGNNLVPPEGFRVDFDTCAGGALEAKRSRITFLLWKLRAPAKGFLQEETYRFLGSRGEADYLTAIYQAQPVELPLPVREGYSFAGWYADPYYEQYVGSAGEEFVPQKDITLYACWADLILYATLNWQANEGKGAVDLKWEQKDGRNKRYLLYQKCEGDAFHRIYDVGWEGALPENTNYSFGEQAENYKVPASGLYRITGYGAQGQNYEDFEGGLGGKAVGTFYLEKGDWLTIDVGGQDGYGGGGKGDSYGGGGGRTIISSKQLGPLLIAGGGGGASPGGNGGAGGLETGLREEKEWQGNDGRSGGGAGSVGGLGGKYTVHIHEASCLHIHNGDEENGGDCYRESTGAGTCRYRISGPYKEAGQTSDCAICIAAGRNGHGSMHKHSWHIAHWDCGLPMDFGSNGWWQCDVCGGVGYTWGSGLSAPPAGGHTYTKKVYVLDCEKEYDCETPPGVALPAYGGSSFVTEEISVSMAMEPGKRYGDGCAMIEPVSVGYREEPEQNGVAAPDLEAPDKVDEESVQWLAVAAGEAELLFSKPRDKGTYYYHQVKSFLPPSENALSESNITCTEVMTGVRGYYYVIDGVKDTQVTKENAQNAGRLLRDEKLRVSVTQQKKYVHLAAVDGAGNIGESISLEISAEDERLLWHPVTEPMEISAVVGGRDYGSVAPGEDVFYVRADGKTPFLLSFEALLLGTARKEYQINRLAYQVLNADGSKRGSADLLIPFGSMKEQETIYESHSIGRMTEGRGVLEPGMFSRALRSDKNGRIGVGQSFAIGREYNGKMFRVVPRAAVDAGGNAVWSPAKEDEQNGLWVIADGEAPDISGLEQLETLFVDRQQAPVFVLQAGDALSGLQEFQVTIDNLDNGCRASYLAAEDGRIVIEMLDETPLFLGDLKITLRATDRVGNCMTAEYYVEEFGLKARIIRLLSPHDPVFKRGESGLLTITAWGYAERIEVIFPEELLEENPGLNRVYRYRVPEDVVTEEQEFMIPLYLPLDGEYTVIVKAYKGDRLLEKHPTLCALTVEGTVLKELRTRLR